MGAYNEMNQAAGWGGRTRSPAGDGAPDANGLSAMPQQRPPRPRFPTAQPPAPSAGSGGQAPQRTFAEMQANGQARPAPPPAAGPPAPAPGSASPPDVSGQLQDAVSRALTSGSRYGLPQVQQVRAALSGNIEREFGARRKQLDEEMARRGLSASTIGSGYYGDLEGQQDSALANMDASLLQNYAATEAQDQAAGLAAGQNYANAQQGAHQFDLQQALAEKLGLGNLDLQKRQLAQDDSHFTLQQQLAEKLGLGNLDLQKRGLDQSATQFDKNYALQQAAQALDAQVKTGQLTLAQAQQKLAELSQQQNVDLSKSSQELQKKQLEQQGDLGNKNLWMQYLNTLGKDAPDDLTAAVAQMLGIPYTPKKAGGQPLPPPGYEIDPQTGEMKKKPGTGEINDPTYTGF